jgi:hypothetical protein
MSISHPTRSVLLAAVGIALVAWATREIRTAPKARSSRSQSVHNTVSINFTIPASPAAPRPAP